jgi:hypothetical protein
LSNEQALTQAQLKELLWYDPDTGVFRWRSSKRYGLIPPWSIAGTAHRDGYWHLRIGKRMYLAHRLAWLYMTGAFPARLIDHKNGCRADNAWVNLREADDCQNTWNAKVRADNLSGVKGVSYCRTNKVWVARCGIEGKTHRVGSFKTKQEAAASIQQFREQHHGEFACHQ